jgi:predicted HicB family RNase H-like nuclease
MEQKIDRYSYKIFWSEEDKEYAGLCLEFHSLSWLAKTPESALRGIRKVVAECVADIRNNGETPPTPYSSRKFSGKLMVRIPPDVHRELAMKAAEDNISLNRLINSKLNIRETLHLLKIPGMRKSIRAGLEAPVDKCADKLKW